jgi:DNA-binding transcriptional ArsR family regulator
MDSPFAVDFESNLDTATGYMKVLANRSRLMVMCKITREPHSVSELVELTGMSQPALSHQLAKLRDDGMVKTERRGKEIYYSIANRKLSELVEHICYQFQCWGGSK